MKRFFTTLIFTSLFVSVIATPLLFTAVNEELFEFIKMMAVYFLASIAVGAYFSKSVLEKKLTWYKTPFDIVLLLFLLSQLLSTLLSMHPPTSFLGYYTRFHGGLLSLIAYLSLLYVFIGVFVPLSQALRRKLLEYFLGAMVAGGVLSALYALPEHFGHSVSCLLVQHQFGVACWVQDVQNRIFGSLGQPNWLAAYMIMLIPLTSAWFIARFLSAKQRAQGYFWLKQAALLAATGLFYMVLLFTKSKSGWLGLVMGMLMLLVFGSIVIFKQLSSSSAAKQSWFKRVGPALGASLLVGGMLLVLSLVYATPYSPSLFADSTRAQSQPTTQFLPSGTALEVGGSDSGAIRKVVWQGAIDVWKRHPLFGSGLETFAYSYYLDRPVAHNMLSEWNFLYNKAHNEFLNYLANSGAVGLITYCLVLLMATYVALKVSWQLSKGSTRPDQVNTKKSKAEAKTQSLLLVSDQTSFLFSPLLPLGLLAGIAALTVSNFFGFSTVVVTLLFWYSIGIVSVLTIITQPSFVSLPTAKHSNQTGYNWWQYTALAAIWIFVLLATATVFQWWVADKWYARGKQLLQSQDWQQGITLLTKASSISPNEALFTDELSESYADIALKLYQVDEATAAAEFVQAAQLASDETLKHNGVHLNFYKTKVRVFSKLAQIDPAFLEIAKTTLLQARALSPTDPSLVFNQARIALFEGEYDQAESFYKEAITLKPNYTDARIELAQLYENRAQPKQALEQYQYIQDSILPNEPSVLEKITFLATASATLSGELTQ